VGDVADLERTDEHRSVAEELAEERLVDLDGLDRLQAHGLRAAVERAVQQVDLLGRHDEVRTLPLPDRAQREERARGDQDGADDRGRRERHDQGGDAERDEQRRAEDRTREHSPVQPGVQVHLLVAARAHARAFNGPFGFPAG